MNEKQAARRRFLKLSPASAAMAICPALQGCGGGSEAPAPATPRERPNFLIIVSDDQRHDTLGCAGHPVIRTPVIDGLSQRGTRFSNAFVTTSICAASRASIFTGLYERTHRFTFETPPLASRWVELSYPLLLQRAGYRTAMIGKFGIEVSAGASESMFERRVDVDQVSFFHLLPDGSRIHETDLCARHAIEWLGQQRAGMPFCLNLSFNAPHAQYSDISNLYPWPPSADGLYEGVTIPPPRLADPAIFDALPDFLKTSFNRDQYFWCCDSPDKYQQTMRGHYRMISGLDAAVGRVLAELQRVGLADDTVVIYMSDNGYYMGERGLAGKWSHFNESLRVPLIVMDPRLPSPVRGRIDPTAVMNVDLAPTVLQLAGLPVPAAMQGRSLVPMLSAQADPARESDFLCEHLWRFAQIPRWEGVRSTHYAYARYFDAEPAYEFLHDLHADPDELTNLARSQDHVGVLAAMRERCAQLTRRYEAARE